MCEIGVQLHSSACGSSSVTASFVEKKTILFPHRIILTSSWNQLAVNVWICLRALSSVLLIYLFVLIPIHHCSFIVFLNHKMWVLLLCFSYFKIDLAILELPLNFHMDFRISSFFKISPINKTILSWDLVWSIQKICSGCEHFWSTDTQRWVSPSGRGRRGNSLAVQWLGLGTFMTVAQVQSLVRELRSQKPHGAAKKKKKEEGVGELLNGSMRRRKEPDTMISSLTSRKSTGCFQVTGGIILHVVPSDLNVVLVQDLKMFQLLYPRLWLLWGRKDKPWSRLLPVLLSLSPESLA